MTNEKINEMWTKLNETKLTGKRAIDMLKKVLTKEECKAGAKESFEYYEANKESLNEKKFGKVLNDIVIKYATNHKFADAKKLMAKIATFVEKIAEENGLEMPEFVFKTTNGKMNKHTIEMNAITLLYQNAMTEEETFKFYAEAIVRIFSKLYGKEINADIENYWNDEVENNEVENNEVEEENEAENNEENNEEIENNADNADNQITIHDEGLDGVVRTMAIRKIFTKEKAVRTKNKISLNATWDGAPVIFEAGNIWKRKKNPYGRVKIRNKWYYPARRCGRIALIHNNDVSPESCTKARTTCNLVLEIIEKITGIFYLL